MHAYNFTRRSMLQGMLAVGIGLFVAACGQATSPATPAPSNAAPAQPTPASGATSTAASAAQPTPAATSEPTPAAHASPVTANRTINVSWWMASRGDDLLAFETSPKAYMAKHPNVKIEFSGDIAGTGLSKVEAAIAAGNPPELVQTWDYAGASGIYYKGGITVLDDYIKASKDFDITRLEPATTAACRSVPDGRQWALPDQLYVTSDLFFNTKMFQDKGLDPTKPPQTLEELQKVAALFDVRKGNQLQAVGFHPSAFSSPQVYAFAFGGEFYDADKQKITPDHPGVIAGLQWLVDYYKVYGVDNLRRLLGGYGQYQSAQNPFLAGQVALTTFWDAMVAYRNRYAPSVQYDQAWFPYAANHPEAKGFGTIGFNPTFIPKGAKERDAAWEVLKFNEMDVDTVLETSILLANTPHLLPAMESPGASKADPLLRKCWDYAAKGKMHFFPPPIPVNAQYAQEWKNQVDLMIGGKVTVKEGVQKIIDLVQPQLDKALRG
jgi:multiple sugar transport system substrate-binding protein